METKTHPILGNLKIRTESQFGNVRNFPACPTSEKLILLTGRKTFSAADIDHLLEAGFVITKTQGGGDK